MPATCACELPESSRDKPAPFPMLLKYFLRMLNLESGVAFRAIDLDGKPGVRLSVEDLFVYPPGSLPCAAAVYAAVNVPGDIDASLTLFAAEKALVDLLRGQRIVVGMTASYFYTIAPEGLTAR